MCGKREASKRSGWLRSRRRSLHLAPGSCVPIFWDDSCSSPSRCSIHLESLEDERRSSNQGPASCCKPENRTNGGEKDEKYAQGDLHQTQKKTGWRLLSYHLWRFKASEEMG